jgi:hypothetical protein
LWPENFSWNYSNANNCAIGLARQTWPQINSSFKFEKNNFRLMMKVFSIHSYWSTVGIFAKSHVKEGISSTNVTPEMVANAIDKYQQQPKVSLKQKIYFWFKNKFSGE